MREIGEGRSPLIFPPHCTGRSMFTAMRSRWFSNWLMVPTTQWSGGLLQSSPGHLRNRAGSSVDPSLGHL